MFDVLIREAAARFGLGDKALPLVQMLPLLALRSVLVHPILQRHLATARHMGARMLRGLKRLALVVMRAPSFTPPARASLNPLLALPPLCLSSCGVGAVAGRQE